MREKRGRMKEEWKVRVLSGVEEEEAAVEKEEEEEEEEEDEEEEEEEDVAESVSEGREETVTGVDA